MFQTIKNAWKVNDLRNRMLFVLFAIVIYRLGANIPVPYVSSDALNTFMNNAGGSVFGYLNVLSGQAFGSATLFALSVSPYITASIVVQLLTIALPPLERWAKEEGDEGKKKIDLLTRIITIVLAVITAVGYTILITSKSYSGMTTVDRITDGLTLYAFFQCTVMVLCYCAGAAIIMWIAHQIDEKGIGNGISMILFANIVAGFSSLASSLWNIITNEKFHIWGGILIALACVVVALAVLVFIVWFTDSERRIPIQYAKQVKGRKMYGGQKTNLPIKLNMSGVMPIIFASSIVSLPATIAGFFPKVKWLTWIADNFNYYKWPYLVVFLVLLVLFAFFYIQISFNPVEVANNIRAQGGSIPGYSAGKATSDQIKKILHRITLIGAIFLCVIAGVPMLVTVIYEAVTGGALSAGTADASLVNIAQIAFGGSSLLIVVGVAIETVRELEAQLSLRNYKGFLD